jgi:hypothetical protein
MNNGQEIEAVLCPADKCCNKDHAGECFHETDEASGLRE